MTVAKQAISATAIALFVATGATAKAQTVEPVSSPSVMPCGSPVFYGIHAEYNGKDGSFNDTIRVILDTVGGLRLWGDFGYPWHYASEADDPFSRRSKTPSDAPIPAQLPPPGFDVSNEPSAVQLTLMYTLKNGRTKFNACPRRIVHGPSLFEILRVPARIFK